MNMTSNKPYLLRAIYEWIHDNHCTPYLMVSVEHGGVDVPMEYAAEGKIVFNISASACRGFHIANDRIVFTARFAGVARQVCVAIEAVLGMYAHENGQGMEFPAPRGQLDALSPETGAKPKGKPTLTLVKGKED